ncbi:MAG: phosphopantetheine-binding protein [Myxococcota bacterium]
MAWTREAVLAAVTKVVEGHAETGTEITEKTELVADLGIDSLGIMEMVADIEDEFGLTIAETELRQVATLGDVVRAIEVRLDRDGELS